MAHLHRHVLHEGPLCGLCFVRCRHPHGGPGPEEEGWAHSLVWPVNGVFVRHLEGRTVVGSPAQLLFFNAGETYRVSHPTAHGDDCLSLTFSEGALFDVLVQVDPAAADRRDRPFSRTHLALEPEEALALHALRSRLNGGEATSLEAEEESLALLARLAGRAAEPRPRASFPHTRARRQEWAEAIQLLLAKDPATPFSLEELGQAVACSPFHLARSFQAEVGLPIHRYALRQRLLASLERLAAGERDLTGLALDLGFASHAHFSATFQRAFRISPSAFRATASTRTVRELRKNAKA